MNTSLLSITVLFFTLLFNMPSFSMISATQWHPDISYHICNRLSKEDNKDFRLVCKDWARKEIQLKLMPKSVEKEYDRIIKKKEAVDNCDKQIILLFLASKNDFEATKWIIKRTHKSYGININNKYTNNDCVIYAHMLAIHNNNPEMARLLLEASNKYKNEDWKVCYKETTVPSIIEECLHPDLKHNFSFLLYLTAVFSDNAHDLKKLYSQKKPTQIGQKIILNQCLKHNAHNCFDMLLKKKQTKKIITEDSIYFFQLALKTHTKELPQKLIKHKLFCLNNLFSNHITILDYYSSTATYDKTIQDILIELGAKTGAKIAEEQRERIKKVQRAWE